MVFKRRKSLPFFQRVGQLFYPRRGWRRAFEYIAHRIKRLPDTPHKIALGFACGAFASFSPLFGFHVVYAAICAFVVRGNILASILGTVVGNPLTFPVIATVSLKLGQGMLGRGSAPDAVTMQHEDIERAWSGVWKALKGWLSNGGGDTEKVWSFFSDVFLPYLVGGFFPGILISVAAYFLARPLIAAYQARRRVRLRARAKHRPAARKAKQRDANSAQR